MSMTTNKQTLRCTADRDWFEEWFKRDFHPNKTGPYIKDQMFFAIQAARAPLLDELEAAESRNAELMELLQWTHDTLLEINPNNYTHNDVCEANAASVEVILGIAPTLGETHGYTKEWWESRAAATDKGE